jgi:SET domain-containing protein 6
MYREQVVPFIEKYRGKFGYDSVDTSLQAFHRMGSLIMSYSFDIAGDEPNEEDEDGGLPSIKAMIPPADVLNAHSRLCNAHLETDDDGILQMVATRAIKKGEQVYNTYGAVPNCDLLRCYGYVEIGGTEFDLVEIDTTLIFESAEDPEFASRQSDDLINTSQGREIYDDCYTLNVTGEPDTEFSVFMMYLSLPAIEKRDRNTCIKRLVKLYDRDSVITEEAKSHIINVFQKRIERYPDTIVAEAKEIKDVPQTDDVTSDADAMAREILLNETRILVKAISWAETCPTISNHEFLTKYLKAGTAYTNGHIDKRART